MSMDFSSALVLLKAGKPVRRQGWETMGLYLEIDSTSYPRPVIVVVCPDEGAGVRLPWIPSHTDLLSALWEMVVG